MPHDPILYIALALTFIGAFLPLIKYWSKGARLSRRIERGRDQLIVSVPREEMIRQYNALIDIQHDQRKKLDKLDVVTRKLQYSVARIPRSRMDSETRKEYHNILLEVRKLRSDYFKLKKSHESREEYLSTLKAAIDATESDTTLVVKRHPDESDIEAFLNRLSPSSPQLSLTLAHG